MDQEDLQLTFGDLSEVPQWLIPRPSCRKVIGILMKARHRTTCAHHSPSYQPFPGTRSQGFCKSYGPRGAQTAAFYLTLMITVVNEHATQLYLQICEVPQIVNNGLIQIAVSLSG